MKEEEQILNLRVKQKHCQVPSRSRPRDLEQLVLESVGGQGEDMEAPPCSRARQEKDSKLSGCEVQRQGFGFYFSL